MLLCRYSNVEYVLHMESKQGLKLILKAIENSNKDKMYEKWLHDPSHYEIGFDDYINAHIPYRKSTKEEKEEILRKWG